MNGIYFYKLVSPYPEDVTKDCKLTINEIDSNYLVLKDNDIKSAEFARDEKTLVLTKNNGEKFIVPLTDVTYNLEVSTESAETGMNIVISFDGADGEKVVRIDNILTIDNLRDVIGSDILTKVITDGTLRGDGTISSPLGLAGTEKTGSLAPAKAIVDLTDPNKHLPCATKLGTRYVTIEYVNDYGKLYNGKAVDIIDDRVKAEGRGWHVATKEDWDLLLNSVEPCEFRNHNSAKCHVELGKFAGKYLKSECGWLGQSECDCYGTAPSTACTFDSESYVDFTYEEGTSGPCEKQDGYTGIDKFGMGILPAGLATLDPYSRPQSDKFKDKAFFWTTTHVYDDVEQDVYVKEFTWKNGGVYQDAECPNPYFSIRLVKEYDGSNFFDSEYIDGQLYKTVLFPQSKQVWLATNYNGTRELTSIDDVELGTAPQYAEVNNGDVLEKRKEMFINEWNGYYWEKRIMHEGDTIVIENPTFTTDTGITKTVCWNEEGVDGAEGVQHCIDVVIPKSDQSNIEYRVYTEEDGCGKILVNTDDMVLERIVNILVPMLDQETKEREKADEELNEKIDRVEKDLNDKIDSVEKDLNDKIDAERDRAEAAERDLWEGLLKEAQAREEVDNQLWGAIEQEAKAREEVDNQLWNAIAEEARAREEVDNQQWAAIEQEAKAREEVDNQLWNAIAEEAKARETVDNQQWDAIENEARIREAMDNQIWDELIKEAQTREEIDNQQWAAIENEARIREEIDNQQWEAINKEREERMEADAILDGKLIDPTIVHDGSLNVKDGESNLVLQTNDKDETHYINIRISSDYGLI